MSSKNKLIDLDRDTLYDLYVVQKLSTPQIGKMYDCTARCIQNHLKRNGILARSFSEASVISMNSRSEEVLLERAKKFRKTWYSRPEEEREAINKTRATKPENVEEAVEKSRVSKMKNNSGRTSKSEDAFYESLKITFGDEIIRQYYDKERYPFNCDFYIPSRDLFIEYQGYFSHGSEPYDKNNKEHQKLLETTKLDMTVWIEKDPHKLEVAKKNNITLVLIYPKHTHYILRDGELTALKINELWEI